MLILCAPCLATHPDPPPPCQPVPLQYQDIHVSLPVAGMTRCARAPETEGAFLRLQILIGTTALKIKKDFK